MVTPGLAGVYVGPPGALTPRHGEQKHGSALSPVGPTKQRRRFLDGGGYVFGDVRVTASGDPR
jgi:hypothetical protein